ncbi:hypothetical protein [Cytobacillus horneckiae]|uniref:hypothetical protein n=1 Tax=Cytobacillus horneckiae TaxID=549687 RepID=UPI003D9A7F0E
MWKGFKDWVKDNKIIVIILSLVILIPVCLNLFMLFGDIKTGTGLGNAEWLAFWGSFLGGAATLTAVFLTLKQNSKVIEDNQTVIKLNEDILEENKKVIEQNEKLFEQNERNMEFQMERERLSLMPYIDISEIADFKASTYLKPPNGYIIIGPKGLEYTARIPKEVLTYIQQKNIVTQRENKIAVKLSTTQFIPFKVTQKAGSLAADVKIYSRPKGEEEQKLTPHFALAQGESITVGVVFTDDSKIGRYGFSFKFKDIQGRGYEQSFLLMRKKNRCRWAPTTYPQLINKK